MNTKQWFRHGIALFTALVMAPLPGFGQGGLTLANPHWNITLTDFGYSDFLLDNTPGFEGREYLSGEWGAAIGYQVSGGASVTPQWLELDYCYPNWTTNSTFTMVSPITQTGLNADGLPIAESIIRNDDLEITQRFEMLDTITGTPMGVRKASEGGAGAFHPSDRYVMKHSYTVKNIAGASISNLQLFQLVHGLNSQRGVYDNRSYTGILDNFRYDTTLSGVDAWATGTGLEDFISFHAASPPTAHEIGYYGIEGNGLDDHSMGKPSEGVHVSIENNWLSAPYDTRQGTDFFEPPTRWVGGAQRWTLGDLAAGQSVGFDVLLSILTGTKVTKGAGSAGSCDGGSTVPGGFDYDFESVETEGTCFSEFARADQDEIAARIAQGEFSAITFQTPGQPVQLWDAGFSGVYTGNVHVKFGYDPSLLPKGFDETVLKVYHHTDGSWEPQAGTVDPVANSITVTTRTLGAFALGVDVLTSFNITAVTDPANGGTISGAGTYAQGSSVSLTATPGAGHIFSNWTEGAGVVSTSPTYTFLARDHHAFVANFGLAGTGEIITTGSSPSAGGFTSGDGEYLSGSNATVGATPNPGYKFSKWLVNGVIVTEANPYTFPVSENQTLVAKFNPVYEVTVAAQPVDGGNPEADPFYEVGELATLKGKPDPGWALVNWTQNGVVLSTDEDFSFNVNSSRDLIATYAIGDRVDLVADPKTAGDVSGTGVFESGTEVTVTAAARPGYVFLEWTEFGYSVSNSGNFTFTATGTPRKLVAKFAALPKLTMLPPVAPGQLVFIWPDTPDWVLEETGNLMNWTRSTRPIEINGAQKSLTVDTNEGRVFFRLSYEASGVP